MLQSPSNPGKLTLMSFKGFVGKRLLSLGTSTVPRLFINQKIKGFGEMLDIHFDPIKRQLTGTILLAGEESPVDVRIDGYDLRPSGDHTVIVINNASVGREWINILVQKLVVGREIRLPADKAGLILEILGGKSA